MGKSNVYHEGLSFSTMSYYFPFSINTALSVSDKLTWLSDACHPYECHSCIIVYTAPYSNFVSQLILCQNMQCRIACLTRSIEFTGPKCRDSYTVCIAWHCDDSEVHSKRQTFYSFHLVRFLYISVHYLSTCNCCTAYALVGQLRSLYNINLFSLWS